MSEQTNASKNIFKYNALSEGCCEVFMDSTDTEELIQFPSEIDGLRVTKIGYKACRNCKNVKTIVIPEGVYEIGWYAFYGCTSLIRIHLPSTLKKIDTQDIFYNNGACLITYNPELAYTWELDEHYLPKKNVVTVGVAGKKDENGMIGLYTVNPLQNSHRILFQRDTFLHVKPYPIDEANELLEAITNSYKLVCKTDKTYDVYSSDGVSPDDHDEKIDVFEIKLENLLFSEDGVCRGIFYKDAQFSAILYFDGTTLGAATYSDRTLCYGHPLDFYINTFKKLTLQEK